jgi:methylated-DNA-protein-cysteine methyltransferase-like protein
MARKRSSLETLLTPLRRGPKPQRRGKAPPESNPDIEALWDVISRVPYGSATTYGDVARAAGLPGRARLAGYALRMTIDDMHLPWHRVVSAGGRIAFPKGSARYREQARLLKSEGVPVKEGRVSKSALTDLVSGDE